MGKMFFDSWESIVRTTVITILAYVLLIFLLRVSGKRTLSKMNAFDLIVTIALGSTLATVMLNKNVALIDGVLGFFLLILLQLVITWLSVRSKYVSRMVKSTPTLLYYRGNILSAAMKKERVTIEEVYAIAREKGYSTMQDIDAIVLETDGSLTVIGKVKDIQSEVMQHTEMPENVART